MRQLAKRIGQRRPALPLAALAALCCLLQATTSGSPVARTPASAPLVAGPRLGATEILRRAEAVRSPDLDYAVDFTITQRDDDAPGVERTASYTMIARGKNRSMVLMVEPKGFFGTTLLIRDGAYWFVPPKSTRPIQLSAEQVLSGDVSNGDVARADLLADYEPRPDGEETIEREPCWRLELTARSTKPKFPRVRAWVAKRKFLPRKLEFYGLTGALIKTARYEDYRKTSLGLRSMKLEVASAVESNRSTTMVFTNLRKVDASPVDFSSEGMLVFRDAAMAMMGTDGVPAHGPDVRDLLGALKRGRKK